MHSLPKDINQELAITLTRSQQAVATSIKHNVLHNLEVWKKLYGKSHINIHIIKLLIQLPPPGRPWLYSPQEVEVDPLWIPACPQWLCDIKIKTWNLR